MVPLNILLIHENIEEQEIFADAFKQLDLVYYLFYHPNGLKSVFDLIKERSPQLIFLDINPPDQSGIHFLKELKANKKYRHIPVIMFSSSTAWDDIQKCYDLGAHYYLVKHRGVQNLMPSLRKVCNLDWTQSQIIPTMENFVIEAS
jgi:DNA-binding response OmpR family regulator